jgi:hypothetical protein
VSGVEQGKGKLGGRSRPSRISRSGKKNSRKAF